MDFEDIVDMDWIDSNTTSDDSLPTSSSCQVAIKQEPMEDHSPFQSNAFDADSLYRFTEQPFLWQQDLTTSASASASCSSPVSPTSSSSLPDKDDDHPMSKQEDVKLPPELMMPSTEHIKQLIEIAKRHLALREQGLRPEDIHGAAAAAAAAASMPLFTTTPTVMPDTVAPESLMKLSAAAAVAMNVDHQSQPQQQQPQAPMEKKTSDVKKPSSTTPPPTSTRRASSVSLSEETMTLEAYAESDGIDIKKLTPKERRQLRNKISARNFRVRRKEYINTLEAQVEDHKQHADQLQSRLDDVEEENKQLRQEVDTLRRQNQQLLLQQQQQKSTGASSSSSELSRTPSSPRVSSPIPKPNLNKDISMLGSKASDTYRQDTRILVSNAVMPVWNFDRIVASQHPTTTTKIVTQPSPPPTTHLMQMAAGYLLATFVQLTRSAAITNTGLLPTTTECHHTQDRQQQQQPLPLLPEDRDFSKSTTTHDGHVVSAEYMEYLYDTLLMSSLESNAASKGFWWWGNNDPHFNF
ncbi:hypothetical protein O0I10_007120 [Lichtheimia ornata]|uniref:BZIP domain-containing protein n=1 Tax=Lichtheimia ornata TaxID=688661 RepID=A0AAD7XUC4_9FUNG|nr:uncharacterized protein O0I10_007120 [Lichtheimia ornata]KAJ8657304.1 hypothetical protein O0I10_007120 [Lichtheimia ornata]